jgi:hypothetical protein
LDRNKKKTKTFADVDFPLSIPDKSLTVFLTKGRWNVKGALERHSDLSAMGMDGNNEIKAFL